MSSWVWPSSVRLSISSRSKSAAPSKIGSQPGLAGDDREDRHLHAVDQAGGHQRPVQRQAAVRAQRHVGLLLEPGDDVDGVTAHDGRVRPVEGFFQRGRHHRRRHAPHPGHPRVAHVGLLGARGQHLRELPVGGGPEDHPLLGVVRGEAVVEQLGALLAPVAAPVAAGRTSRSRRGWRRRRRCRWRSCCPPRSNCGSASATNERGENRHERDFESRGAGWRTVSPSRRWATGA